MAVIISEVGRGGKDMRNSLRRLMYPLHLVRPAWKQNGSEADTGAWFLAVSNEKVRGRSRLISVSHNR